MCALSSLLCLAFDETDVFAFCFSLVLQKCRFHRGGCFFSALIKKRLTDRVNGKKVEANHEKTGHFQEILVCFSRKIDKYFGDCGSRDRTAKSERSSSSPLRAYASGVFLFFAFTSSLIDGKLLSISE